jgi:hypothetical protein
MIKDLRSPLRLLMLINRLGLIFLFVFLISQMLGFGSIGAVVYDPNVFSDQSCQKAFEALRHMNAHSLQAGRSVLAILFSSMILCVANYYLASKLAARDDVK